MKQKTRGQNWVRGGVAAFIGLMLLAATLPNTGGIMEGPERHGMSRCGPFLFYPGAFFMVVGAVTLSTGCTLFGIARNNATIEMIGWILLGVIFFCVVAGSG